MNKLFQLISRSEKIRTIVWSAVGIVLIISGGWIYLNRSDFSMKLKGFETTTNNFFSQTLHTDNLMPPPLRGVFGIANSPLTNDGVLSWTNKNRTDASLPALVLNKTLSDMAQTKLKDMFDKQYFEHTSPTGVGPSDLAKKAGYDYIVIGENLALGNFDGDKALLDAWMASPGHRANILNVRYKEIGVAVGQGTFEGKTMWIAVQEFGLPITACPQPSTSDKTSIDKMKVNISSMETTLTTQKTAIDNVAVKYGTDYNTKVNTYNTLVHQYNDLVVTLKAKILDYNKQVAMFNNCAELATTTPEKI